MAKSISLLPNCLSAKMFFDEKAQKHKKQVLFHFLPQKKKKKKSYLRLEEIASNETYFLKSFLSVMLSVTCKPFTLSGFMLSVV